jgi:hypothetical protein
MTTPLEGGAAQHVRATADDDPMRELPDTAVLSDALYRVGAVDAMHAACGKYKVAWPVVADALAEAVLAQHNVDVAAVPPGTAANDVERPRVRSASSLKGSFVVPPSK